MCRLLYASVFFFSLFSSASLLFHTLLSGLPLTLLIHTHTFFFCDETWNALARDVEEAGGHARTRLAFSSRRDFDDSGERGISRERGPLRSRSKEFRLVPRRNLDRRSLGPSLYPRTTRERALVRLVHLFTRSPARLGVVTHRCSISFPFVCSLSLLSSLSFSPPLCVSFSFSAFSLDLCLSFFLSVSLLTRSLSFSLSHAPFALSLWATLSVPYTQRDRFTLNMHRVHTHATYARRERMPNDEHDCRSNVDGNNEPGTTE